MFFIINISIITAFRFCNFVTNFRKHIQSNKNSCNNLSAFATEADINHPKYIFILVKYALKKKG